MGSLFRVDHEMAMRNSAGSRFCLYRKIMDAIFAFLVRFLEGILDRYAMERRFRRALKSTALTFVLALIGITLPLLANFKQESSPAFVEKLATDQDLFSLPLPDGAFLIDGKLHHLCKGNETKRNLAQAYYSRSEIFNTGELGKAFEEENPGKFHNGVCLEMAAVSIPGAILAYNTYNTYNTSKPLYKSPTDPVRAVYLRGDKADPDRIRENIDVWLDSGINGIVIDVKDITGVVNYRTSIPAVERIRKHNPPIPDFQKLIRFFHERDVYVIARMALFQDQVLAEQRPDLAIRDVKNPRGILHVKGRPLWVDPGYPDVRKYNLDIVAELVTMGVDEIQFDYVRYPAEGDLSGVKYHLVQRTGDKIRNLTEFLSAAWKLTRGTGVKTAIDVFGIVAWGESQDAEITGQKIEALSSYVDVISPMLYPSHFQPGYEGIENPADHGYYFYSTGVHKILAKSSEGVRIRPWLQAFPWRVTNYNEKYILDQIRGSRDGGGVGWMMWNASNDYDVVYRALKSHTGGAVRSGP